MAKIVRISEIEKEKSKESPLVDSLLNTLKDIDKELVNHLKPEEPKSTKS